MLNGERVNLLKEVVMFEDRTHVVYKCFSHVSSLFDYTNIQSVTQSNVVLVFARAHLEIV